MALTVVVAACGRDEEPAATTTSAGSTQTTAPAVPGLAEGGFGDLGVVCGPAPEGTENTASDVGVTADSIQVSTVSDPGFAGRPGLNQEMFDTAEAFADWCNEQGGINGRTLDLELRDAALTLFQQQMIDACEQGDFMTVGGGAVFDDTGQEDRLACGLPNIAGYVVTATAAEADLTVQPIPNPASSLPIGDLLYLQEQFPDSVDKIGVLTGNLPTTVTVAERYKEGIAQLGWEVVYDDEYPAAGVEDWRPFAEGLKSKGVEALIWVGEPVNLGKLLTTAQAVDYELQWIRTDANHYDPKLTDEAGAAADNTFVRSVFAPFLEGTAEAGSASEQYNQLIDQYKPGGVKAYLGVQALSSWLLFATAARDCGADLTRDCVFEKTTATTSWSGGGLHAPVDLSGDTGPACFNLFQVVDGEFTLAEIGATDGIYNCDDGNLATLTGDYGTGARCPNPAYADDPKPSNCAEA